MGTMKTTHGLLVSLGVVRGRPLPPPSRRFKGGGAEVHPLPRLVRAPDPVAASLGIDAFCWHCVGENRSAHGPQPEIAYAFWRSRLPWWRRLGLWWREQRWPPAPAGHIPPRPVPAPAPQDWHERSRKV